MAFKKHFSGRLKSDNTLKGLFVSGIDHMIEGWELRRSLDVNRLRMLNKETRMLIKELRRRGQKISRAEEERFLELQGLSLRQLKECEKGIKDKIRYHKRFKRKVMRRRGVAKDIELYVATLKKLTNSSGGKKDAA